MREEIAELLDESVDDYYRKKVKSITELTDQILALIKQNYVRLAKDQEPPSLFKISEEVQNRIRHSYLGAGFRRIEEDL